MVILHKNNAWNSLKQNKMRKAKKTSTFFEKTIDKQKVLGYNRRADFRGGTWSLKIEQHEIWKAQDCAFSLRTHWETQKSKKKARILN